MDGHGPCYEMRSHGYQTFRKLMVTAHTRHRLRTRVNPTRYGQKKRDPNLVWGLGFFGLGIEPFFLRL